MSKSLSTFKELTIQKGEENIRKNFSFRCNGAIQKECGDKQEKPQFLEKLKEAESCDLVDGNVI